MNPPMPMGEFLTWMLVVAIVAAGFAHIITDEVMKRRIRRMQDEIWAERDKVIDLNQKVASLNFRLYESGLYFKNITEFAYEPNGAHEFDITVPRTWWDEVRRQSLHAELIARATNAES